MAHRPASELVDAIGALSDRMLAAAQGSQWDALVTLQRQRHQLLDALQAEGPLGKAADQERIRHWLEKMLAMDAEIIALSRSEKNMLGGKIQDLRRAHNVRKAYGA